VIHTPGHTPDSVIYYAPKDNIAFVGDTIFKGSIGNWQYPGGNPEDLQRSIIQRIFTLPDQTVLYSGHSDPTTVGTEKRRYRIR
jgi:glyoxylase-like metal-dependent hydrolase (beta-lactamase superfamily II)